MKTKCGCIEKLLVKKIKKNLKINKRDTIEINGINNDFNFTFPLTLEGKVIETDLNISFVYCPLCGNPI